MALINSSKTDSKEEVVLPLLSAKAANKLAASSTKEMELQKVADLIRITATANKYKVSVTDLNYPMYVYEQLISKGYIVVHASVNSLNIMWTNESIAKDNV
jgi:hypothetical protein